LRRQPVDVRSAMGGFAGATTGADGRAGGLPGQNIGLVLLGQWGRRLVSCSAGHAAASPASAGLPSRHSLVVWAHLVHLPSCSPVWREAAHHDGYQRDWRVPAMPHISLLNTDANAL